MGEAGHFVCLTGDAAHGVQGRGDVAAYHGHLVLDIGGGGSGLLGEFLDFASDDAETFPMHARAGGLDRGIQGKDAGLGGDGGNEFGDFGDSVAGGL